MCLTDSLLLQGRELREAGKFHHDPQTGAEVRAHSLARSERDYSAYGRRKRITGFVADLRQAFMVSSFFSHSRQVLMIAVAWPFSITTTEG